LQSGGGISGALSWPVDCRIRHWNFNSKGDVVLKNVLKNLDLNAATEQELTVIFGSDYAKKVVDDRNQNGPFKSWEDLKRIPGIVEPMLDTLKRLGCTVGRKAA